MHVSLKSFKAKLQTQIFSKEKGVTIIDLLPIIISASFKCAPGATVVAVDKNNYICLYIVQRIQAHRSLVSFPIPNLPVCLHRLEICKRLKLCLGHVSKSLETYTIY